MKILIEGEAVEIHADGTLYWPRERILVASDLHLGKEAAFRSAGLPVPEGAARDDLERLAERMDATGAGTLVITGDFLHARAGMTPPVLEAITTWRGRLKDLRIVLTLGNHDLKAGRLPDEWEIEVHRETFDAAPFLFRHDPVAAEDFYVLAGHVHPVLSMSSGNQRVSVRVPCFHFGERVGVLPAFGNFTGGHPVDRQNGDRTFAIADGRIFEV